MLFFTTKKYGRLDGVLFDYGRKYIPLDVTVNSIFNF